VSFKLRESETNYVFLTLLWKKDG